MILFPYAWVAGTGNVCPIAQMNPASSRATNRVPGATVGEI
jgi:hypothetical protein